MNTLEDDASDSKKSMKHKSLPGDLQTSIAKALRFNYCTLTRDEKQKLFVTQHTRLEIFFSNDFQVIASKHKDRLSEFAERKSKFLKSVYFIELWVCMHIERSSYILTSSCLSESTAGSA